MWFDTFNARWENDLFKTIITKTSYSDSLETVRELDILQAYATIKRVIAYILQRASRLEDNLFQVLALPEGAVLNLFDALRNDYSFYLIVTESFRVNLLQSLVQYGRPHRRV